MGVYLLNHGQKLKEFVGKLAQNRINSITGQIVENGNWTTMGYGLKW
jgi:hypothetical protein